MFHCVSLFKDARTLIPTQMRFFNGKLGGINHADLKDIVLKWFRHRATTGNDRCNRKYLHIWSNDRQHWDSNGKSAVCDCDNERTARNCNAPKLATLPGSVVGCCRSRWGTFFELAVVENSRFSVRISIVQIFRFFFVQPVIGRCRNRLRRLSSRSSVDVVLHYSRFAV